MRVLTVVGLLMVFGISVSAQAPVPLLRDQDCGTQPTLVMVLAGVSAYATCETVGASRIVRFVLHGNGDTDDRRINSFSMGFCAGPILSIQSPNGWASQIRFDTRVEWAVRSDDRSAAFAAGTDLDGFSVTLHPGWIMAGSYSVAWVTDAQGGGAGSGGSRHHCQPLLFR